MRLVFFPANEAFAVRVRADFAPIDADTRVVHKRLARLDFLAHGALARDLQTLGLEVVLVRAVRQRVLAVLANNLHARDDAADGRARDDFLDGLAADGARRRLCLPDGQARLAENVVAVVAADGVADDVFARGALKFRADLLLDGGNEHDFSVLVRDQTHLWRISFTNFDDFPHSK